LLFLVGDLKDGSETSSRFRQHLESRTDFDTLKSYIDEALGGKGEQFNKALQDLVNAVGTKLDFDVEYGRYRGVRSSGIIGYDGLWRSNEGKYIIIETKTTSAYQIDTSVIMGYIQQLALKGYASEDTFGLYVIGRFDVSGLENIIKGAGLTHKLRIIGCDDLIELLRLKDEAKLSHGQILSLMLPFDNVNIGGILEVIKAILSREVGDEPEAEKRTKRRRTGITHQKEYRIPLMQVLVEAGGRGKSSDICNNVEEKMRDILKPADYEKLKNGKTPRWENFIRWTRQELVTEGFLKSDSPRGMWEITNEGRAYLERVSN
jgi:hypothetical protein